MSASPHANGGQLTRDLELPEIREHGVTLDKPATTKSEATRVLGCYLRDVLSLNSHTANFRIFHTQSKEVAEQVARQDARLRDQIASRA